MIHLVGGIHETTEPSPTCIQNLYELQQPPGHRSPPHNRFFFSPQLLQSTSFSLTNSIAPRRQFLNLNNRFCSTTCWEKMSRAFNLPGLMNLHKTSRLVPLAAENKKQNQVGPSPWSYVSYQDTGCSEGFRGQLWILCWMYAHCLLYIRIVPLCIRVVREVPCKVVIGMLRWMVLELILTNAWDHWRDWLTPAYLRSMPGGHFMILTPNMIRLDYTIFFKSVESTA